MCRVIYTSRPFVPGNYTHEDAAILRGGNPPERPRLVNQQGYRVQCGLRLLTACLRNVLNFGVEKKTQNSFL